MTTTQHHEAPLLLVRDARIDRDGTPICERLSLQADGERVVLAGAGAQAVGATLANQAKLVEGSVLLDGHDVGKGEHIGKVGVAPLDLPLPPRMTASGYIALSLRTAGVGSSVASLAAASNLADLGLSALATRRTESMAVPERRAVLLAAAMIPGADAVVAQAPLSGLEGSASHYMLAVLGQLAKKRRVLATSARLDPTGAERDLILGATHVLLIDRTVLVWSGSAASLMQQGPLVMISIRGRNHDAFMRALTDEGFTPHGVPPRFALTMPHERTGTDLLALADATDTAIVQLMPLLGPAATEPQPPTVEPSTAVADQEQLA